MREIQTAGKVLDGLLGQMSGAREGDRTALAAEMAEAGGAQAWAQKRGLHSPVGWTEAAVVEQTLAFWEAAASRQQQCGQCPPEGGLCAADRTALRPGDQLAWRGDLPIAAQCDRWPEHAARTRSRRAGVPERLLGCTFGGFEAATDAAAHALKAVADLVGRVVSGRQDVDPPWIFLSGPTATGKSHLLAAAVRNLRKARPLMRVCYRDVSSLQRPLKLWFAEGGEDPLDLPRRADVLVLDSAQPSTWASWFTNDMQDLLRPRWDGRLPTLIASREEITDLAAALSSLTGITDAVQCKLK